MFKPQGLFLLLSKGIVFFLLIQLLLFTTVLAFYPQKPVISGNTDDLNQLVSQIDPYTPAIQENLPHLYDSEKKPAFLEKPEIAKTKTREEIENEKKKEATKKLALDKRNVLARDRNQAQQENTLVSSEKKISSGGNSYWYGFCTWYAAERRADVPNNWGNARSWLSSAQKSGWPTGPQPRTGAIIVTGESWAGHVGYVENTAGNSVTITEMNFHGWARVTSRTLDINDSIIRGYIY